jgi:hypothetical protein
MSDYEVSSREQLFALMGQKPKSVTQKECKVCGYKLYRVIIKGVEHWMGCKCSKIKAHHHV